MMNRPHRKVSMLVSVARIRSLVNFIASHNGNKKLSPGADLRLSTLLALVLILPVALGLAGCSTNSANAQSAQTPLISIGITQAPPPSLTVGAVGQVSATVNNDIANAGVDWVATCSSAPNCGSFSPAHTPSGGATNFTAPLAVPSHGPVIINALSSTDHSKGATASVAIISTVSGVTITQPAPASAPSGAVVTVAATVTGDPSNEGLDWKSTCGTVDCTPPGWHEPVGMPTSFTVPGPLQIPTIVGSTVTLTAFATADHTFSASTSFVVSPPISINISQPPPGTMATNATATIIAVVSNDTTNSGVSWAVSCAVAPCGTFTSAQTTTPSPLAQSASGAPVTFTAPPTVPAPHGVPAPVVTITATAAATSGPSVVTVTVNVTIVAPVGIQITQSVPNNSLVINRSAPVAATVTNDPANAGVDWTVTCSPGPCGTFSPLHTASGTSTTFTAPAAAPPNGIVTITAASTTSSTTTATETVSITNGVPPNSLLLGQFVMLLCGKNSNNGPYCVGGVLKGDGVSTISSGSFDVSDASGNASGGVTLASTPASTYLIGPDGHGQMQLYLNSAVLPGNFGVSGTGLLTLSIVFVTETVVNGVVTQAHALLTENDSFGAGTGTLDFQSPGDLASFTQGAWTSGIYSLQLTGTEASSPHPNYFLNSALSIDLSASSYSYVTDQSDNGVITSVPFVAVASPNVAGTRDTLHGELTFNPVNLGLPTHFNLDVWMIDLNHYVVTDWRDSFRGSPNVIIGGYLTIQPSSPSISGTYGFTTAGATSTALPQVAGGLVTCGSTGTLDAVPLGGTALSNVPVSATCTAPLNGRGLITISGTISGASTGGISQFAVYPTIDPQLYLIELDGGSGPAGTSGPSSAGVAILQASTPPLPDSIFTGKYAADFLASTALGSENLAGSVISDGISTVSGTADLNSFNASPSTNAGTPSSGAALTAPFTAAPSGRFPLTFTITPAAGPPLQPTPEITTIPAICYIVSAGTCMLLGSDPTAPGTGILLLQNTGL